MGQKNLNKINDKGKIQFFNNYGSMVKVWGMQFNFQFLVSEWVNKYAIYN